MEISVSGQRALDGILDCLWDLSSEEIRKFDSIDLLVLLFNGAGKNEFRNSY